MRMNNFNFNTKYNTNHTIDYNTSSSPKSNYLYSSYYKNTSGQSSPKRSTSSPLRDYAYPKYDSDLTSKITTKRRYDTHKPDQSSRTYKHESENNNDNLPIYENQLSNISNNISQKLFLSTDELEQEEDFGSKPEFRKLISENNNLKKEKEVLLKENSQLKKYKDQFKSIQNIFYRKRIIKTQNDSTPIEEIIESIINDKNSNNDRLKQQANELKQLKNTNEQNEITIKNIQQKLYQLYKIEPTKQPAQLDQLIDKIFSEQKKCIITLKKENLQLKKNINTNPSTIENRDQGTVNVKEYIIQRMKLKEEFKNKTEIELAELIISYYENYRNSLKNIRSHIVKKSQIRREKRNIQIIQLFDDVFNSKEEDIKKLTNEISILNEKLITEKERFDQELSSLSIENERYRKENESRNFYQHETETKANSKLKPTTNEPQTNLTDQIQQIQTLLISLQETKTNSEHQNSEIEAKENEIQQLIKKNEKYQQKIDDLEKMISELKTQLKNQQDLKIEEISQKSAEMKESIEKLKTIASKLNKEKKTKSPIDDDEEIDNDKFDHKENLKDQIDHLKEKIEGRENSISSLRNKKDELENKLIANLEEKVNDQDNLISSLNNIKHQLDELVKILKIDEIQDDDYSPVKEKVQELVEKCTQNDSQIQELKKQNKKQLSEIKEKDTINSSLTNEKEQFERQQQKRKDFVDELIKILKIDKVKDDDYQLIVDKINEINDKANNTQIADNINDNYDQIQSLQNQNEELLSKIEYQQKQRKEFSDKLTKILKINEILDDNYSPIIEKINEIIANANNNSNQSNDIQNNDNDQMENLKNMINDLQSKISEKENIIKNLIHQKELLGKQKDLSNDLLRRHIVLIQTENDKQLRRIRYLQQQEIKEIIGSDEEEDNDDDGNNKDNNNNDDDGEDEDDDLLSE